MITPRQARLFSSFSRLMENSVRNSRLRLLTGGLLNFIMATPVQGKHGHQTLPTASSHCPALESFTHLPVSLTKLCLPTPTQQHSWLFKSFQSSRAKSKVLSLPRSSYKPGSLSGWWHRAGHLWWHPTCPKAQPPSGSWCPAVPFSLGSMRKVEPAAAVTANSGCPGGHTPAGTCQHHGKDYEPLSLPKLHYSTSKVLPECCSHGQLGTA